MDTNDRKTDAEVTTESIEKLDLISRLMTVQLLYKDFSEMNQREQIRVLNKHGLRNKEISNLLGVKPPNVSAALKK